jgi:hypothetical protein
LVSSQEAVNCFNSLLCDFAIKSANIFAIHPKHIRTNEMLQDKGKMKKKGKVKEAMETKKGKKKPMKKSGCY